MAQHQCLQNHRETLNLRDVRIFDTVEEDGMEKRVLNKETAIAQQKQEAIRHSKAGYGKTPSAGNV